MGIEFRCICKDCGVEFGYSEASIQASATRGLSRPERCPACRRIHSMEGRAIGIPQIPLRPIGRRRPDNELSPGRLGKIFHPERPHRQVVVENKFGKPDSLIDFGITDDDIRHLFNTMREHQVVVVVGPTGSGKSTFLPYRLMVPPEGIEPDIFTRYGQIVITQPRTQATRSIAAFVARDLHGSSLGAGFDVGFRHRDAPMSDWRNKLVYVTDGTLINWIVSGQLDKLSVIMIDEAHERSLNIDLILGLLKQQLPRYPMLKLIIASATINAELFQNYYGGPDRTPLITFRGLKQYGVEAYFPPGGDHLTISRHVPQKMADKACQLLLNIAGGRREEGDILCFLPGAGEIETCIELLRAAILQAPELRDRGIGVYPLYSSLPQDILDRALAKKTHVIRDRVLRHIEENTTATGNDRLLALLLDRKSAGEAKGLVDQAMDARGINGWHTYMVMPGETAIDSLPGRIVFATHAQMKMVTGLGDHRVITDRRVIISTNVAETSLTVDGIVYVVDSGLIKQSRWDPVNGASELPVDFHSRSGCRQRWGRAGRVRDGEAHMLYTDVQFEDPDIFLPHTEPEIRRSCLEEIVLKAKAAGINDIAAFDWIQPPPAVELSRAPAVLRNMGALDDEGDLTGFGMELQTFMTGIPVAGLLVAADRFACGVEMATLAALNAVQFRNLLSHDWRWDFATRAAVEKIHAGLAASCRDDLDFFFKLYSICAETPGPALRKKLCALFFLNEELFTDKIQQSRRQFLEMLAIGKKSEEDRTIAFAGLDRFRFILAVTLPEHFLFRMQDGSVSCLDPSVQLPVNLDEASVLSETPLPLFLALGRRVATKGDEKRLLLSCLIRVEETWLAMRGKAITELALYIARGFGPDGAGDVSSASARARILADVYYPAGSTWSVTTDADGTIRPESLIDLPEPLTPVMNEEKLDIGEDTSQDDIGDIDPLAGTEDKRDRLIAAGEEKSVPAPVLDYDDDEASTGMIVLPEAKSWSAHCIFQAAGSPVDVCEITGIGQDPDSGRPVVNLSPGQDAYRKGAVEGLVTGRIYRVKGEEVLASGGRETALAVSLEDNPGQRYIISAGDLSFSRRFLVPSLLVGKTFDMQAVARQGAVCLSRLSLLEQKLHDYLAGMQGRKIPCRLLEIDGRHGRVLLEDLERESGIVETAYFYLHPRDRQGVAKKYSIGNQYNLLLQDDCGQAHEPLYLPSEKLLAWVEENKHRCGIFYNHPLRRLHSVRPMTSAIRAELAVLLPDRNFATALARLYRLSNRITVAEEPGRRPLDSSKSVALEEYRHAEIPEYRTGEIVRGRISAIQCNGVLVVLNRGGRGKVMMQHLTWDASSLIDPRERVYAGQEIEVRVLEMKSAPPFGPAGRPAQISISLSLLKKEDFPEDLREAHRPGTVHAGRVMRVDDARKLVLVKLESGIVGLVPNDQITHCHVFNPSDHLQTNQEVQVTVLRFHIDPLNAITPLGLTLSIKELLPAPNVDYTKYRKGSVHQARITRIYNDKGFAFAELAPGLTGFIHLTEVAHTYVEKITDQLKEGETVLSRVINCNERERKISLTIKNAFDRILEIDRESVGCVVGTGGKTVKEIQAKSGCRIDCDFKTGGITVKGPTEAALDTAERLIQECLEQHPDDPKRPRESAPPPIKKQTEVVSTVIIPKSRIGLLIGKKAVTISRLKTQSHCGIWCDEGKTSIRGGSREHVQKAVELITQLIPEATWDGVITEKQR